MYYEHNRRALIFSFPIVGFPENFVRLAVQPLLVFFFCLSGILGCPPFSGARLDSIFNPFPFGPSWPVPLQGAFFKPSQSCPRYLIPSIAFFTLFAGFFLFYSPFFLPRFALIIIPGRLSLIWIFLLFRFTLMSRHALVLPAFSDRFPRPQSPSLPPLCFPCYLDG